MKKHYLVYKTTCLINGKIYIGQHQTYDPNDNYLGSGSELNSDIQKFGRDNFKREVLFDFDTFKEMDDKEKELVTEEFISREDTYNVRLGGQNEEVDRICAMGREKQRQLWKENGDWANKLRKKISNANRIRWNNLTNEERKNYGDKHSALLKSIYSKHPEKNGMFGKKHSESTRRKMRESHRGEKNNQYGKMWICNDSTHESKTIMKTEPIPEGWRKGRLC